MKRIVVFVLAMVMLSGNALALGKKEEQILNLGVDLANEYLKRRHEEKVRAYEAWKAEKAAEEAEAAEEAAEAAQSFQKGYDAYEAGDYATALAEWTPLAEAGDEYAQYWLGWMYIHGQGVERDYVEAEKWYRLAAEAGNALAQEKMEEITEVASVYRAAKAGDADAQYNLGLMHDEIGSIVSYDDAEAVKWWRLAAEGGHTEAQNELGEKYYYGWGVDEDKAEAAQWYRLAAEAGHAEAQYRLGGMHDLGKGVAEDDAEAQKWYRRAFEGFRPIAESGDISAQYRLGRMYIHGEGVEPDYVEAEKWYRLAAEGGHTDAQEVLEEITEVASVYRDAKAGDADAQYNLGLMHDEGVGIVSYDKAEAEKWWRLAVAGFRPKAEAGDADAQYKLGDMYESGYGVVLDYVEAEKWYRRAAEAGDTHAQEKLEEITEQVSTQRAAEAGDAFAQYKLAGYHLVRGGDENDAEAVKWFRLAAEQGNAFAQGMLGYMYADGSGVAQDHAEADKWYRRAVEGYRPMAEAGDADAQASLGEMYYKGRGVAQDDAEAVKWYRLAAEAGNAFAQNNLGDMYANGVGVEPDYILAYMWKDLAADVYSFMKKDRDKVAKDMTPEQIAEAKAMAEKCRAQNYKNCDTTSTASGTASTAGSTAPAGDSTASATDGTASATDSTALAGDFQQGYDAYQAEDYATALAIWTPLAEAGDALPQSWLGHMYKDGKGVAQDDAEANKWYRLAAEAGDGQARRYLGLMYENGRGVEPDYILAYMWYNLAADVVSFIKEDRDKVAKDMTPEQIAEAQAMTEKCRAQNYKGC